MSVDVAAICLLGCSLLVMVAAKVVIEIAGMRALLVLSDQIDPSGRLSREFLEEQAPSSRRRSDRPNGGDQRCRERSAGSEGASVTSARAYQNGDRGEVRVMFPDGPRMLPATCSYAPEDDDVFSEAEWEIDAVEGWVITRLHSGLTVAEIANERGGRSLAGNVEYLARSRESDDGEWHADVFLSVTIGLMTFTGYGEAFHEPYAEIAEQVASDNALKYIIDSFDEHIDLSVDTIQWSDNAPWITEDIDAQLSPDS